MRRILVATDGSDAALEATRVAIEIAEEHGAELLVAHVVRELDVVPSTVAQLGGVLRHEPGPRDRELLEGAAALARDRGVSATTVLLRGETVDELVRYAAVRDVDLVVVGSRGHGAVAGVLLGSVSQGLLRESRRPVLIVRAPVAVGTETESVVLRKRDQRPR